MSANASELDRLREFLAAMKEISRKWGMINHHLFDEIDRAIERAEGKGKP